MSDPPMSPIGGEIAGDRWHFARMGEVGPLPNPTGHTFLLLTHDLEGRWRLVGTGFYRDFLNISGSHRMRISHHDGSGDRGSNDFVRGE